MIITDADFDKVIHTFPAHELTHGATGTTCSAAASGVPCENCRFHDDDECMLRTTNTDFLPSLARYLKAHPEWAI